MKSLLLIVLMLLAGSAYAGINKWLDENNHVHYSDQPPPAKAKARKLAPLPTAPAPAAIDASQGSDSTAPAGGNAPKTIAEREAEWRKAQQAKREAAEKAEQEQAKRDADQSNCLNARHNLKVLESGGRIVDVDDKGERYFLSDEQLAQRAAKANGDIERYCK